MIKEITDSAAKLPTTARRLGLFALSLLFLSTTGLFAQSMTLEIPQLKPGSALPKKNTAGGKALSPPLVWTNLLNQTKEYALIFEDVEGPRVHWLLYSIPAKATRLREGIPKDEVLSEPSSLVGTIQGITDFKQLGIGYIAPTAEAGKPHRYVFTLYALDARLGLQPGLDKASLLVLMQGHIIGKAQFEVRSGN